MTLRSRIADIIGRTKEPSVLDLVLNVLACKSKRGIRRAEHARSEAEILCGARILQEFTLLATRTYEGKSVTTGIVVGEKWAFKGSPLSQLAPWVLRWPEHSRPSREQRADLFAAAVLADGRRSLMVADTMGRIRGIINIGNSHVDEVARAVGGYAVITNRHREVFLFNGVIDPVCHHNGFEWRPGGYIGPLIWVRYWAYYKEAPLYEKVRQIGGPLFEKVRTGELPIFSVPTRKDAIRWHAFENLIGAISDRRLSAIFAVCDAKTLKSPEVQALLSPLRPELNNVQWSNIDDNAPMWANLFRLDGVHFVSKQMRILAVCQRISVPVSRDGTEGTGRAAARFLSEKLNASGVVIKVSADGPAIVFYKGQMVDDWINV